MQQNKGAFEVTIDLETLDVVGSKKSMPIILSIGAVGFNPSVYQSPEEILTADEAHELKDGRIQVCRTEGSVPLFYTPVSLAQSLRHGFTHSADTVKWWEKQRYNMLEIAAGHTERLIDTFARFAAWLKVVKPTKVWANSPVFDVAILREAFDLMGMEFDVYFRDERDIRTAREFAEVRHETKHSPDYYIQHHALFDAAWEAWVVQAMYEQKRLIAADRLELTRLRAMEFEMTAAIAKSKDNEGAGVQDACRTTKG